MPERPRDPDLEPDEAEAPEEPGSLLRDTHREIRHRPLRRAVRPDRHPVVRDRPHLVTDAPQERPIGPERQDPRYWRWAAALTVAVMAAAVIATWMAAAVGPGTGPSWPWLLVGTGELLVGGLLIWSSWPRARDDVDWRRALSGTFGGLLLAFAVLSFVWALRLA